MKESEWLSTKQIALKLGMTSEWVRREIVAGRLSATYYDGRGRRTYRVHQSDLRTYLRQYQRETGSER